MDTEKTQVKWENKEIDCVKENNQYTTMEFFNNGTYIITITTNNNVTETLKGKWKIANKNKIMFFDNYSTNNKNIKIGDHSIEIIKTTESQLIIKEFVCIEGNKGDEGASYYKKQL